MNDAQLERFIETDINSPVKLQILMLFANRTIYKGTAWEISQRAARDIWSVTDALASLVESRLLKQKGFGKDTIYTFDPPAELQHVIQLLVRAYDDPIARDSLHNSIRNFDMPVVYQSYGSYDYFGGIA